MVPACPSDRLRIYVLSLFHYPKISASFTNIFCIKTESPSVGDGVKGASLSTEKQDTNLVGYYLAQSFCLKKMVRPRVTNLWWLCKNCTTFPGVVNRI